MIKKWPIPTNVTEVHSLLGFTNYYCRLIKKYDKLNDLCTHPPILAYADFGKSFKLHTDVSVLGLGAVLYQEQDGVKKVISYTSESLSKSESKYPIHTLECLCLKWAITNQFHQYLFGTTFDVYTDNNPLTYIYCQIRCNGA